MSQFLTYTIIGLCAAGTFAIAAGGLVLTYTTTGIFNFAHGATAMLGAFAYWQLRSPDAWNLPAPLALFLVIFVLAPIFGFLIEVVIMRRLQGSSEAAKIVVSISLLAGMLALGQWVWSPDNPHTAQPFFEGSNVHLLGVNVSWHEVIGLLLAVVVAIGLRILLYRTRAGIAMRASVTVSIAEAMIGMLSGMARVRCVRTSASDGRISDRPGFSSTSSNVNASRIPAPNCLFAICQLRSAARDRS